MSHTEPTLDEPGANPEPSLAMLHEHLIAARAEMMLARKEQARAGRRILRATIVTCVAVVASSLVVAGALLVSRDEAKKTQEAVAGLREVEKTLAGLTDVQAQEIMKRKMLREIQARAAKAAKAAQEESGGEKNE